MRPHVQFTPMVVGYPSDQQKARLRAAGYYIENMGNEHGPEFDGMYRWLNEVGGELNSFQDTEESFSEDDAWREAWNHFKHAEAVENAEA